MSQTYPGSSVVIHNSDSLITFFILSIFCIFKIEYNFEYLQCPVRFVREAKKNGGDIQPMSALNVSNTALMVLT